jgi:hypothetical protein
MDPIFSAKVIGGILEVYESSLSIIAKGIASGLNDGKRGSQMIPFSSITAIHYRKPGFFSPGHIKFIVPGVGKHPRFSLQPGEENDLMFYKKASATIIEIKKYVESKIFELRQPASASSSNAFVNELMKLADLKNQGLLSDDEFNAAKARLLA